jgi:tRNA dimethylallyltransferase
MTMLPCSDFHGNQPLVIFLMGPTAVGKTDLAIALSRHFPAHIISVDSAMIYRGMDIGTAKPSPEELQKNPHALLDMRDPSESYSAADFCRDALHEIKTAVAEGKTPLLVGGTMMYFNALLNGLADMPATDEKTRREIDEEGQDKGWPAVHAELMKVDPDYARKIHPNHSQRIARALAVYRLSGKTMTTYRKEQVIGQLPNGNELQRCYTVKQVAMMPRDRFWLHERIALRYHAMLQQGFVEEVTQLYKRGDLTLRLPSMKSVGYRQVWQYLAGEYNYESMVDKGIAATRQLAKRQMTWLRGWDNLHCVEVHAQSKDLPSDQEKIIHQALKFLSTQSI